MVLQPIQVGEVLCVLQSVLSNQTGVEDVTLRTYQRHDPWLERSLNETCTIIAVTVHKFVRNMVEGETSLKGAVHQGSQENKALITIVQIGYSVYNYDNE